jgi:hypothetical protein
VIVVVVAAFDLVESLVVVFALVIVVAVNSELATAAVDSVVAVKIFDHNNYRSFVYLVNLHLQLSLSNQIAGLIGH